MQDTTEAVLREYEEGMAARTPGDRLRMALDMYDSTRMLTRAGIVRTHPGASEAEIEKLLFLRFYERDLPQSLIDRVLRRIEERYTGDDATGLLEDRGRRR